MMNINEEEFLNICNTSSSMMQAAAKLKLHFNTFKKIAVKLGCYKTNQGGKGTSKIKKFGNNKFSIEDILDGKHPQYQTYKLKNRLLKEGIKSNKCEICGLTDWMNESVAIELHHIDGDRTNHRLDNLEMICPNCHSQTKTFRAKNINGGLDELV